MGGIVNRNYEPEKPFVLNALILDAGYRKLLFGCGVRMGDVLPMLDSATRAITSAWLGSCPSSTDQQADKHACAKV
jgi:hypothetical protein